MNTIQLYDVINHEPSEYSLEGEWLDCEVLGDNTAKVVSLPFLNENLCPGDVVEYDDKFRIVRVVESNGRIRRVKPNYDLCLLTVGDIATIVEYFKVHNIVCENVMNLHFALGVPNEITEDELVEICAKSPVKLLVF